MVLFVSVTNMNMEKLFKIKRKLIKFLSKQPVALSLVTIQNPTLSPCRSPAPVSIVPKEVRRKHRAESFSAREPGSPKVSCMGQVESKKKKRKARKKKRAQAQKDSVKNGDSVGPEKKKIMLWIQKDNNEMEEKKTSSDIVETPSLNTMKKFSSGRGSLYDFDFTIAER